MIKPIRVSLIDSPMQISSNTKLWLPARKLTGLSIGDPISTFTDYSGTSNHGTQTGTARATLGVDSEGYKYANFNWLNTQFYNTANSLTLPDAETIVFCTQLVYKIGTVPERYHSLLNSNNGSSNYDLNLNDLSVSRWTVSVFTDNTGALVDSPGFTIGVKLVGAFIRNYNSGIGGYMACYNGLVIKDRGNFTVPISASWSPYNYVVGKRNNNTQYLNGALYELVVIHEELNPQKLRQLIRMVAFNNGVKI